MRNVSKSILIAGLIWVSSIHSAAANFVDVDNNTLYDDAINYVERENIVSGYSDNTYRPSNLISRGEFVKIVVSAHFNNSEIDRCIADHNLGNIYDDVPNSHVFAKYICVARVRNLVNGYSNGDFGINDFITLGEASKILVRGLNLSASRTSLRGYTEELIDLRAIPIQLRSLNEYVTRGQMAEMIYRVEEKIKNRESLKEVNLYDRIVIMEFENYDSSDFEIKGRILDRLNYSVFKNNEGERIILNVDKKSADKFLDELDNDREDTVIVYINDNKVKFGYVL